MSDIKWGPEFHGSKEISEVLCGEFGVTHGTFDWGTSTRGFSESEGFYRLPADHWFYKHPLFTGFVPDKWLADGLANKDKLPDGVVLPEPVDPVLQAAREAFADIWYVSRYDLDAGKYDHDVVLKNYVTAIRKYIELTKAKL